MPVDANGNTYYEGYTYRLRAGSPIYDENGNAYLHTFGSETNRIIIYDCVKGTFLPSSDDFMGQGGSYMSASFSKVGDRDDHFQGRIVYEPEFGSESVPLSYFAGKTDADYGKEIVFIECTSLNVSYDIMGLVTVSYTVVSNTPGIKVFYNVSTGGGNGVSFSGFPTSISYNVIPNTTWYETHVTLMAVTSSSSYSRLGSSNDSGSSSGVTYPDWWYKKGKK
jgi:hypothetical protein